MSRVFQFERHELDVGRYELRRAGRVVRLPRLPMELLILLIDRRGLLVTRNEIISHLWQAPDTVETGQGINTAINRIRTVLHDDPSKPRFVETVVGKGYRFIGDVDERVPESPAEREPVRTVEPVPDARFWRWHWFPVLTFLAGLAVGLAIRGVGFSLP